ncbi:MAG: hypothetical protein AB7F91_02620 [Parvularculaceae bacterium]|nr:hypothetical protein [Parvularculaceae bacterium]
MVEFEQALDLAGDSSTSAATVDITCHDDGPDEGFCAGDFADVCAKKNGGLSTEPDGGITCSVPTPAPSTAEIAVVSSAVEFNRALRLARRGGGTSASLDFDCSPPGEKWCSSGGFATACDDAGGGMSTNPDGTLHCSVPD